MATNNGKPMCLFPAFEEKKTEDEPEKADAASNQKEWLENQSFPAEEAVRINEVQTAFKDTECNIEHAVEQASSSSGSEKGYALFEKRHTKKRKHGSTSSEEDDYYKDKHKKKKKKEKHKHKHKHKSKHKKERHKRNSSKERNKIAKSDEKPIPVGTPSGKVFIEDMFDLKPETALRFDTKPDSSNWNYLTLYKMNIARYHRLGRTCLGLDSREVFLEKDKKNGKKQKEPDQRYWQALKKKKLDDSSKSSDSFIGPVKRKNRFESKNSDEMDFISVKSESGPKVEHNVTVNPLGIYDSATERYLQGRPSVAQEKQMLTTKDDDEQFPSDLSNTNPLQKKKAMYNKHLQENPHDITKWIEFVDFQSEDVSMGISQMMHDSSGTKDQKRSHQMMILEIQASVLERALEKNPASIELKMKRLEVCTDLWESERLEKEWEKLVFTHPNNAQVWWLRLLFLQSNSSVFSIGKLIKAYGKCLSTLASIRDGTFKSHPALPYLEENMIVIYKQLIRVLTQAGHREKAVALLQANIELNIFCPDVLQTATLKDQIEFLESFWDSAVPRSGEVGALGFASWVEKKGDVPFCSMYGKDDEMCAEDEALKAESRCEGWLSLEASRSSRHLFPWRPDVRAGESEEDCEDLERIVILDDIMPCLFAVKSHTNKLSLIRVYLEFLGIHISQCHLSTDPMTEKELRTSLDNLSQVIPLQPLESKHLFSPPGELEYQAAIHLLIQITTAKVFTGHIATFLDIALLVVRRQYLGFKKRCNIDEKEWKTLCKDARKSAKNVMKEELNRNNLLLWEQFIFLETLLGSTEDVRRIFDTALSMTPILENIDDMFGKCITCKLYRRYAEMELGLHEISFQYTLAASEGHFDAENTSRALHVLTTLPQIKGKYEPLKSGTGTAPTRIVAARRYYQMGLEAISVLQRDKTTKDHGGILRELPQSGCFIAHWTVCYALFQYVTHGINAAVVVFDQAIDKIQPLIGGSLKEKKQQTFGCQNLEDGEVYYATVFEDLISTKLRLIQRHLSANVVPLGVLRTPLQQNLEVLPDSPDLLHQYTLLEGRTNIVGRLRRQLLKVSSVSQTPLVWVYGVVAELARQEKLQRAATELLQMETDLPEWLLASPPVTVGSRHQLRAWLERAVTHPISRYSVLLWRLFFYFEISEGCRLRAKTIYYRAINQCPAAKALCVDFIRAFPDSLEEVTDFMLEKELRLRTPLEELDVLLPAFKPKPPTEELGLGQELEQEQELERMEQDEACTLRSYETMDSCQSVKLETNESSAIKTD